MSKKLTLDFAEAAKGMAPVEGAPDARGTQELSDDDLDKVSGGVMYWDKYNCGCGSPLICQGGMISVYLKCPNCGYECWASM